MPRSRHNSPATPQIGAHGTTTYYAIFLVCDRGGIGIRAGFRILWGDPSGFESRRSHLVIFQQLTPRVGRATPAEAGGH